MTQPVSQIEGNADALITEMKRRVGADTDTDLARVLGTSQSNVSTWRKRQRVPQGVLLRFDRLNLEASSTPQHRLIAARALALRAADLAKERVERRGGAGGTTVFMTFAMAWDAIVKAIAADLERKERVTKRWPTELAGELAESEVYMNAIIDWAMSLTFSHIASPGYPTLPQ